MFMIKVSILVPCYNCANKVDRMVNSVINNGYDLNYIELILMNDGSTDNTMECLNNYASTHPFIKAYDHEHVGLCKIRTELIKKVTSDYFIHVDADDEFETGGIEILMEAINAGQTPDIVVSKTYKHKLGGRKWPFFTVNKTYGKKSDFKSFIKYSWFFSWNKVYSKKFYDGINYQPIPITASEDLHFIAVLLLHKPKMIFTNKNTYHYISHPNSSVHERHNRISNCKDHFAYFENILEILKQPNNLDQKTLELLTQEIFFIYFLTLIWFYKHTDGENEITFIDDVIMKSLTLVKNMGLFIKAPKGWWKRAVYFLYLKSRLNKFLKRK